MAGQHDKGSQSPTGGNDSSEGEPAVNISALAQ